MNNTAIATIDLEAVRHNLARVRQICPSSKVMAMVKADAYGHGTLQIARTLEGAEGLAVARLNEALFLRRAGVAGRLLLLPTLLAPQDLVTCSEENIDVVAHDDFSVQLIAEHSRRLPLCVWLKLDSGMHRAGLNAEAFMNADRMLSRLPGIVQVIHMSHFSSAGDVSCIERQMSCFWRCHAINPAADVSLANSGAIILAPNAQRDWVRPGIMLYGDNPINDGRSLGLVPAMTLRSYVIAIRKIGANESVGYNSRWTSQRTSIIGTVGIGYGDGYPRHAPNGTPVCVNGTVVPLVGQVSMDSLMVDLTENRCARVGDEAILWGKELPVAKVAEYAETISYELLTRLSPRVTREYVG